MLLHTNKTWLTAQNETPALQCGKNKYGAFFFLGHFPRTSPIISGSFAEKDPKIKNSMRLHDPVCTIYAISEISPSCGVVVDKK